MSKEARDHTRHGPRARRITWCHSAAGAALVIPLGTPGLPQVTPPGSPEGPKVFPFWSPAPLVFLPLFWLPETTFIAPQTAPPRFPLSSVCYSKSVLSSNQKNHHSFFHSNLLHSPIFNLIFGQFLYKKTYLARKPCFRQNERFA